MNTLLNLYIAIFSRFESFAMPVKSAADDIPRPLYQNTIRNAAIYPTLMAGSVLYRAQSFIFAHATSQYASKSLTRPLRTIRLWSHVVASNYANTPLNYTVPRLRYMLY